MPVTTCQIVRSGRPCGKPVPESRQEVGPWLCEEHYRRVNREVDGVYESWVPMVADVLQVMRDHGLNQEQAVRRLGGIP